MSCGRPGLPSAQPIAPVAGSCPGRGALRKLGLMTVLRSIGIFIIAAISEIGGAYLVWQGVRQRRGMLFVIGGVLALGLYGFAATFQPFQHFGRILAAYGGVFVAGSLAWGMIFDGFRPDRFDLIGAGLCVLGVAVIMYAPRAA